MPRLLLLLSALALAAGALPLRAAPAPTPPKVDDAVTASAAALLEHRKVQKELKMSAEARLGILDGLADIDDDYSDKINALVRKPNAAEEDYDKLGKERQKQVDKLLADTAAKALTAAQRVRLQQFDYRVRGPAALTDPVVEKKLQLTDGQKKAAKEAAGRVTGELEKYIDGDDEDGDAANRKAALFDFRKARLKELVGALDADQKSAWEALLGAAPAGFDADELWLKIEEEKDLLVSAG